MPLKLLRGPTIKWLSLPFLFCAFQLYEKINWTRLIYIQISPLEWKSPLIIDFFSLAKNLKTEIYLKRIELFQLIHHGGNHSYGMYICTRHKEEISRYIRQHQQTNQQTTKRTERFVMTHGHVRWWTKSQGGP